MSVAAVDCDTIVRLANADKEFKSALDRLIITQLDKEKKHAAAAAFWESPEQVARRKRQAESVAEREAKIAAAAAEATTFKSANPAFNAFIKELLQRRNLIIQDSEGNTLLHRVINYSGWIKKQPLSPWARLMLLNELEESIYDALIVPAVIDKYMHGHDPVFDIREKEKPRPDCKAFVNKVNKEGETPLMLACQFGLADIANYLLFCGADVKIRSNRASTDKKDTALRYLYNGIAEIELKHKPSRGPQVIGMDLRDPGLFRLDAVIIEFNNGGAIYTEYEEGVDLQNLSKLYKLYKELMKRGATAGGRRKTSRHRSTTTMRRHKYKQFN